MLVQFSEVTFSYPGNLILKNCSFQLNYGCRIGLVGRNGVGKTTIFKLISGELSPDSGTIYRSGKLTVGFHRQTPTFPPGITIDSILNKPFSRLLSIKQQLEKLSWDLSTKWDDKKASRYDELMEIFHREGGYEIETRKTEILTSLKLDKTRLNQNTDGLSGGEKVRLSLTLLLLQRPQLLLLDEPTNHLDIESIEWLEKDLKDYPGCVVFISHDRSFLEHLPTQIFELQNNELTIYPGPYSTYIEHRFTRRKYVEKQYIQQQKQIKKLEYFIRKNIAGQKTKQAQSRMKTLASIKKISPPSYQENQPVIKITTSRRSFKKVLEIKNILKYINNKLLFSAEYLTLQRGDKIGILGPNGSGKTTFLKILLGETNPDQGEITWGDNIDIGFYDQYITDLKEENTILDDVWAVNPDWTRFEIQSYLARFLFSGDDVNRSIATLSGGEKARVALAKLFARKLNVIIMDEPTNHLDIPARESLENAIRIFDGSLLIVTHDRYLLNKVTNHVWAFENKFIHSYLGNYTEYLSQKQLNHENPSKTASKNLEKQKNSKKILRKRKAEHRKRLGKSARYYEKEIQSIESELADIQNELANPNLADDWIALEKLSQKKKQLEHLLEQKMDLWLKATEMEEQFES